KQTRIAFERGRVQRYFSFQMLDAPQPMLGIFNRHAADDAVPLVSAFEQELGQIRAILTRNAADQGFFRHRASPEWEAARPTSLRMRPRTRSESKHCMASSRAARACCA